MEARMLLGVTEGATAAEVLAAFRRRVRSFHPDHGGPGGDMDAFVAAKHVLLRNCPAAPEPAPARSPYGFSAPTRTGRHLDLVA